MSGVEGRVAALGERIWSGLGMLETDFGPWRGFFFPASGCLLRGAGLSGLTLDRIAAFRGLVRRCCFYFMNWVRDGGGTSRVA